MIELYETLFKLLFLIFVVIFGIYLLPNIIIYSNSHTVRIRKNHYLMC